MDDACLSSETVPYVKPRCHQKVSPDLIHVPVFHGMVDAVDEHRKRRKIKKETNKGEQKRWESAKEAGCEEFVTILSWRVLTGKRDRTLMFWKRETSKKQERRSGLIFEQENERRIDCSVIETKTIVQLIRRFIR